LNHMGQTLEVRRSEVGDGRVSSPESRRFRIRVAKWISAALIVAGSVPLQILYYLDYRVYSAISILMVAALVYASASVLALAALFKHRMVGSGIVSILTGLMTCYGLYPLGLPLSILPGAAVVAAGVISIAGSSVMDPLRS
jgi:hypothetical protein